MPMRFNSVTGKYEDDGALPTQSEGIAQGLTGFDLFKNRQNNATDLSTDMQASPEKYDFVNSMVPKIAPTEQAPISPKVREYLAKKLNKPELAPQRAPAEEAEIDIGSELEMLPDESKPQDVPLQKEAIKPDDGSGFNFLAGLGALGAGLQGNDAIAAGQSIRKADMASKDRAKSQADLAQDMDPNSEQSKMAQELAAKMMPGRDFSKASAAQLKKVMPNLETLARLNSDAENRKEAREERRSNFQMLRGDRQEARDEKAKILNGEQTKQRGNLESGLMAEEQFRKATSGKDGFKPEGVGQWIDNSEWAPNWLKDDKAVESQAAQNSWVETFLRDASGAAIAPSERGNYARDYFPVSGDSKEVIANKQKLREQKVKNAAVGSKMAPDEVDKRLGSSSGNWNESKAKRLAELRAKAGK